MQVRPCRRCARAPLALRIPAAAPADVQARRGAVRLHRPPLVWVPSAAVAAPRWPTRRRLRPPALQGDFVDQLAELIIAKYGASNDIPKAAIYVIQVGSPGLCRPWHALRLPVFVWWAWRRGHSPPWAGRAHRVLAAAGRRVTGSAQGRCRLCHACVNAGHGCGGRRRRRRCLTTMRRVTSDFVGVPTSAGCSAAVPGTAPRASHSRRHVCRRCM
jgi:hypothetical protein